MSFILFLLHISKVLSVLLSIFVSFPVCLKCLSCSFSVSVWLVLNNFVSVFVSYLV